MKRFMQQLLGLLIRVCHECRLFLFPATPGVFLYRLRARPPFRRSSNDAVKRLALDTARLRSAWVLVAGASGLGALIETLARMGVNVVVCDADHVELSNLSRGRHSKWALRPRQNKAIALVRRLARACASGATLIAVPDRVEKFLATRRGRDFAFDVVVGAVDNDGARSFLQTFALESALPFVSCGVEHEPPYNSGYSFVHIPGQGDGACFNCYRATLPAPRLEEAQCGGDADAPFVLSPIVEMTAGQAALHVTQILSGGDPPAFQLVHVGDGGGRTRRFTQRRPGCPCSKPTEPIPAQQQVEPNTAEGPLPSAESPPEVSTWAPL